MFASALAEAMLKSKPPRRIAIGHGARLMMTLNTLLPTRLREYVLRRAYGLTQLA